MSAGQRTASLLGFGMLAGYASLHWFALIANPPVGRWALVAALALAVAAALDALGLASRRRALVVVLALAAVIVSLLAGLLAIGIPARLLAPGAWGELRAALDAGLAGVSQLELPYEGGANWTRLGILLAAPLVLTLAAAIAFWPSRAGAAVRRWVALALLVALYAVAVTWESPSAELAHGLGLLACVACFLWLGRVPASRAVAAAAAVAVAGLVALPAAARVDTAQPAVNYAGWKLFGNERIATFDWDHTYGPLDWPQRGTELFVARGSDRPLYWKTVELGDFDGEAWSGGDARVINLVEEPRGADLVGLADRVAAAEEHWIETVEVSILGLRSPLLVTTGATRAIDGVDTQPSALAGTTSILGPGLVEGDSYALNAYAPDPSAQLLKRRDDHPYPRALERYTTLLLPQGASLAGVSPAAAPVDPLVQVVTPLRGSPRRGSREGPGPGRLVADTPYARVRSLALRLTRSAAGTYQAVAAIERHLLENYRYEQNVPERREPLPAFLFRDRAGYCQQFSGAMALMLRLVGIPSRVVAGFAPGQRDLDTGAYLVRDTDAHSWVEVWFPKVGWVTVDPTPSIAPARTEIAARLEGSVPGAAGDLRRAFRIEPSAQSGRANEAPTTSRDDKAGSPVPGVLFLAAIAGGAALAVAFQRRRRRLLAPAGAEPQLRELYRVLPLLGGTPRPGITLLGIERQLAAALGPSAASYAAALRANRYRRGWRGRPGPDERRMLRRALARGHGVRGRVRAFRAIPPGGPRAD